jgi:hypothetical protein
MNSPTRRVLPKLYPPELSDAGAIENAPTEATSTDGQEMDSPTRRVLPELYPPERSGAEAIEKAPKEADCTDGEEIVPEQLEAQSYSDDDGRSKGMKSVPLPLTLPNNQVKRKRHPRPSQNAVPPAVNMQQGKRLSLCSSA